MQLVIGAIAAGANAGAIAARAIVGAIRSSLCKAVAYNRAFAVPGRQRKTVSPMLIAQATVMDNNSLFSVNMPVSTETVSSTSIKSFF